MFEPTGKRARWRVIYDLLEPLELNETLTYHQMAGALELDPEKDRKILQQVMQRAAKEHLQLDKRAIEVIPNVGYRIVEPPEQLGLARRHQKKSSRALVRGHAVAANVDLSKVDAVTRHALDMVAQAFALQMDFNRRFDVRQQRLEAALATVTNRTEKSERELEDLRERLDRLENSL